MDAIPGLFWNAWKSWRTATNVPNSNYFSDCPNCYVEKLSRSIGITESTGDFCKALRDKYSPRRSRIQQLQDINTQLQQLDEPYVQFDTELQTLIRRAGQFTLLDKLEQIYTNLHHEYWFYIRRTDFINLKSLRHKADEFEDLLKQRKVAAR